MRAFTAGADLHDLGGQGAAVGIAEHEAGCAAFGRGFERGQRVLGRVLVAIEKVLGVIDHLAAVLHQMGHRVADHRAVFLDRGAQDFGDLHFPALAENRDHRRFRLQQQAHLVHRPRPRCPRGGWSRRRRAWRA